VVEIRNLTTQNIQHKAGFCFQQLNPEAPYSEGDEDRYLEGKKRKAKFLEQMLKRGGRAKIAYIDNNAVGFIEYYPIEIVPMGIVGKNLMVIFCMDVKEKQKGIGAALLNACLEDSRGLRQKCVAVTCSNEHWMSQSFFEKHGFIEVVKGKWMSILVKKFEEVENPNWLQGSFKPKLQKGKIVVSIFQNDRCPVIWRNAEIVRKVADEFKKYVEINEYDTNTRENILKYKEVGAIYVNERCVVGGPPVKTEAVRRTFEEELLKMRKS
jgi:hypothetical protein